MARRAWLGAYLRGVAMGAADAVPGVSGGTVALLVGIYERLIAAVTDISPRRVFAVAAALARGDRVDARRSFAAFDGPFLAALGAGILTAVVAVTRLLDVALEAAPVVTFGLFFGLIGASAVALYADVSVDTAGRAAAAVAGFALAFVLSGRAAAALGSGHAVTFLAGAVAVSAMILPGVSGSLLLLILGQYTRLVDSLRAFVDGAAALATGGGLRALGGPAATVLAFCAGGLVGLFTVAHAVRWALARRRAATLTFLVSLIVGALRAPVLRAGKHLGGGWTPRAAGLFALAALVGAAVVAVVERRAGVEMG